MRMKILLIPRAILRFKEIKGIFLKSVLYEAMWPLNKRAVT